MKFGKLDVSSAEGAILAHSVRRGAVSFKKGRMLSAQDVAALADAGVNTVFAARLEAGDIHEDVAAARLAVAVTGDGLALQDASTGEYLWSEWDFSKKTLYVYKEDCLPVA